MFFFRRAASFAAHLSCALALLGASTPGRAVVTEPGSVTSSALADNQNVPTRTSVPAVKFAPSSPVVQSLAESASPAAAETLAADNQEYATLDAAVAAQKMPDTMADDLECLATAVFYESKGEPLAGQLAVAQVIMNRTESGRFPRSICSVVTQPGQFSFVRNGAIKTPDQRARHWATAVAIAQVALKDGWDETAPKALYFHARRLSPQWGHDRVATIGNHVFYR